MKYLEGKQLPVDEGEFNSECGVGKREHSQLSRLPLTTSLNVQNFPSKGYSITPEDLYTIIINYVSTASLSGWDDLGRTIGALKGSSNLRWANPLEVKNTVEKVFTEKFGDKSAAKAKAAAVSPIVCPSLSSIHLKALARRSNQRKKLQLHQAPVPVLHPSLRLNRYSRRAFWANSINQEKIPRFTLASVKPIWPPQAVRFGLDSLQNLMVSSTLATQKQFS